MSRPSPPPGFKLKEGVPAASTHAVVPRAATDNAGDLELFAFLQLCRSEQYYNAFVDGGWDDVQYLLSLEAMGGLDQVTSDVGMKSGHALKFAHYVGTHNRSNRSRDVPTAAAPPSRAGAGASPSAPPAKPSAEKLIRYQYAQPKPAQPSWAEPQSEPKVHANVPHLGMAYPIHKSGTSSTAKAKAQKTDGGSASLSGTKRPLEVASSSEAEAEKAARAIARAKALRATQIAQKKLKSAAAATTTAVVPVAVPSEGAEMVEAAMAVEAAQFEAKIHSEMARMHEEARPLSANGVLLNLGIPDDLGNDQRKVGATVWLTDDESIATQWGRATWQLADLRVKVTSIDAGHTFNADAVPPGRYSVSALPLSHITRVQLSGRELRGAEGSARRDLVRIETAAIDAQIRQNRLSVSGETGEARAESEAARRELSLKRAERERIRLALPDKGAPGAEEDEEPRFKMVVHRVTSSNRVNKTDLPEDLALDSEAVEVWNTAVEIKRTGGVADRWVRGWRMKMIARQSFGGGSDIYIRAPDMAPDEMPSRHQGSTCSIRSFTALVDKLRKRLQSGASSGAADSAPPLRAACYFAPSTGRVVLELHVLASSSAPHPAASSEADGSGAMSGASPSAPHPVA